MSTLLLYLRLFYEFFHTGLFAIGGGIATLPFLQSMAAATGWFDSADLADMIAVSESTPGAFGINMATYVGYNIGGIPGAIIATLGIITPSIITIIIIFAFLQKFRQSKYVDAIFYGLRPASTGLIVAAIWEVVLIALLDVEAFLQSGSVLQLFRWKHLLLAAVLLAGTHWEKLKNLHPIVWIAIAAAAGVVFQL